MENRIRSILANEKYKGDALLQKSYTIDFLTKKRAENKGVVPKYYVENSHPAIIDKDTWAAVQVEIKRRKEYMKKHHIKQLNIRTFTGRVICGKCGHAFGRIIWNSSDEHLRRLIWQCKNRYPEKGKIGCTNKHIDDFVLDDVFIKAFNSIVDNKQIYLNKWHEMLKSEDKWLKITAKRFIDIFNKKITEFDEELFLKVVEKIEVLDGVVKVCCLEGSEV